MLAFATSCGALGYFALRFRGWAPRYSGAVHCFASVRCGAVEKARRFSTYPQFVFHSLFHGVEKMSTLPCVFHRLSVFPRPGAPIPSRRGEEKSPSRARIYNIGAEKGEKGSGRSPPFVVEEGCSVRGVPSGSPAPWGKASRASRTRGKEWGSASAVGCPGRSSGWGARKWSVGRAAFAPESQRQAGNRGVTADALAQFALKFKRCVRVMFQNNDLRRAIEQVFAQLFHSLVHIPRENPAGAPLFRKMCCKSVFYALCPPRSREKTPRDTPRPGVKVAEEKRGLVCAQNRVR